MSGALVRFEPVRGTGDAEIARLAELQHGHVHLHQLHAAGIGRHAVAHRVRTGRLHATLPSVYLVGRPQLDVPGRMMAAVLYCKGDALVAGRAALQLWGLLDTTQLLADRDPIDVLLFGRNAHSPAGVRINRTASLARQDIRRRDGIPVVSPARAILACAGQMDDLELESALSSAFRRNLARRPQLNDVIERNPGTKHIGRLRALLEQADSLQATRSKYERKLLRLLRAAELPLPLTNVYVGDREVDGLWPDLKLAYEFDGWLYHREKFERDRLRDQYMLVAGHQVFRISGHQIDFKPHALIARVAGIITARRLAQ